MRFRLRVAFPVFRLDCVEGNDVLKFIQVFLIGVSQVFVRFEHILASDTSWFLSALKVSLAAA